MANRCLWEGDELTRRPMKHSIAVSCGELKATFGTDLVCAAVQQVKTVTQIHGYDHLPVSRGYMRAQYPLLMALRNDRLVQRPPPGQTVLLHTLFFSRPRLIPRRVRGRTALLLPLSTVQRPPSGHYWSLRKGGGGLQCCC